MEKIGDILVIFKELDEDIGTSEYFKSFITYLAGAVAEDLLKELKARMKEILKMKKNLRDSFLEDLFEDLIKERLEKATAEATRKGMEEGMEKGMEEGMDNKKLTHPRNKFFKDAFSRVQTVQSFIGHYLFPEESALIDLSTLEAVKDSHINTDLQELSSDAVYTASTPDRKGRVYLLFEHESYPDPMVGVRLLINSSMVLQYHERQHGSESVPVTFTVLICHGKKSSIPCDGPVCRFVPNQECQPLLPDLRFTFIDLRVMDDNRIKGDPYLRILFLTLKYIHSPELLEKIGDILVIFKELDENIGTSEFFKSLTTYLAGTAPENLLKELKDRMKGVLKMEKDPVDSFLEEIFEARIKERLEKATTEALRKGREEGIKVGRGDGGREGHQDGGGKRH